MGVVYMEIITNRHFRNAGKYLRALIICSLIGLALVVFLLIGIFIYAKILGPPQLAVYGEGRVNYW